ncbi:hypothetical protein DOTSEDRAFT_169860 [Dothistroma septosporum NZE10]|uniref:RBR-type E3 ubiquitin transferase n=1 Tax=Dothistroma septosporum (strain NZE10 / CBS 128990) TaxID=675120 RepID=N1PN43_DOTSN|nr:hypothetical protein DOTSEDRAFT_169860 [Dothistroma septosporum NZE10]
MSKRKLRSDTALEGVVAEPIAIEDIIVKKAKKNVVRYLCSSCDVERTAGAFPDYNPSSECEHLINTCKDCLKAWVNVQIETAQFATGGENGKRFGVKCPECPAVMKNVNIQIATTKKMYASFEKAERKHIVDGTPGWRWCLAPNCDAGQLHESKAIHDPRLSKAKSRSKKKQIDPETNVEDICTCNECGARACVSCDRPYHEGEICAAYQDRVKDRTEEEDKSLRAIERITRKCPNCKKNIQKNGGCRAMQCAACNVDFCWTCLSQMDQGYCKCFPRPAQAQHR